MGKVITSRTKWYEYLFMMFIILWSGGGFTYGLFSRWMFFSLPIFVAIILARRLHFNKSEILTIFTIVGILLLQMLKHGGGISTVITPVALVLSCSMLAKIIHNKFSEIFVNIIYITAFITFVLWCVSQTSIGLSLLRSIASSLPQLGWDNIVNNTNVVDSLYIYSIPRELDGVMRNCGPFWEAGRFTIYINLALAINIFYNEEPLFSKRNFVLILTNITTFSTTGYIAMGVLLAGYVLLANIKFQHKVGVVIIMALVIPYVVQLDFMSSKIIEQSHDVDLAWSRFGAIVYHWGHIVESPLVGYGPFLALVENDLMISPNGLTDLIRYYGIPFSICLFILLFKSTRLYIGEKDIKRNICVFLTILLLCFSQTITISPFFYLLYFFALNTSNK